MNFEIPFTVNDPAFGPYRFARVVSTKESLWGPVACLQHTPWESLISVVKGEDLSRALYGDARDFLNSLKSPPWEILKRFPGHLSFCEAYQNKSCVLRSRKCGLKASHVPICYQSPQPPSELVIELILLIQDKIYPIVVAGKEYTVQV